MGADDDDDEDDADADDDDDEWGQGEVFSLSRKTLLRCQSFGVT